MDLSVIAREPSNTATRRLYGAIQPAQHPISVFYSLFDTDNLSAVVNDCFVGFLQPDKVTFSHLLPKFTKRLRKPCVR